MLVVRKLEYLLNQKPDLVFSRIPWAVQEVTHTFHFELGNNYPEMEKEWIGTHNRDNFKFNLIGTQGMAQTIIHGKIEADKDNSRVSVKVRLGIYTIAMWLMILVFLFWLATSNNVSISEPSSRLIGISILTLGVACFIWTQVRALNYVEKKLDELFSWEKQYNSR